MVAPERSPAQVPENQHNNQTASNTESYDAARVPTSTGDTPVYENWKPAPIDKPIDVNKRNKFAKGVALGSIGTVAAGLVGGWLYLNRSSPDNMGHIVSNDREVAAPPLTGSTEIQPTISGTHEDPYIAKYDANDNGILDREERDVMSPEDYTAIDEETRAEDRAERFNLSLEAAWINMEPSLSPEEREVLYMPDLKKPRSTWTGQDYLNYYSIATWLATVQTDTEEALRALSVVSNIDTKAFQNIKTWIENNPGVGAKAIYKAVESPLNDTELSGDVEISEASIGDDGGRLVGHVSLANKTGNVNYTLYVNRSDDNGNIITTGAYTYESDVSPSVKSLIEKYS